MADNAPVGLNRTERILVTMIASIAGLSIVAIIAVVIGSLVRADLTSGAWPVAAVLPGIGLPLALVLIIVFAAIAITRRRRLARGGQ